MQIFFSGNQIILPASLKGDDWVRVWNKLSEYILSEADKSFQIDCRKLKQIDTAGVAVFDELFLFSKNQNRNLSLINVSENIQESIVIFSSFATYLLGLNIDQNVAPNVDSDNFITAANYPECQKFFWFWHFSEKIGDNAFQAFLILQNFIQLLLDMVYWSLHDVFRPNNRMKGAVVQQGVYIGANALGIIALMSFLVGLVLGLQSAAQLRQFGANIFIVHLIGISMTREMGPLMTAIILAGRSGSAFAAEIATMKVSEELDALHVMALNPIRFVVVPKVYGISMSAPLLTIIADVLGILGGFIIAVLYLDLTPYTFFQELIKILIFKDILTSLVKSMVFAWLIVAIGSYYGFQAKGGPEGVGLVTTQSVVASIFGVIIADSILGLLFYF